MSKDFESKKPDPEVEEKDRRFKNVVLPRLTPILAFTAILVSLFAAFSEGSQGIEEMYGYIERELSNIIIGLNILVSLVAFILLVRQPDVRWVIRHKEKFKSLAELKDDVNVDIYTSNLNNRVDKLVSQFKLHLSLFAISLVLVYIIIALTKYTGNVAREISYFMVATNLVNLIGGLFVHCAFIVLYNKTLVLVGTSSRETVKDANEQFKLETTQSINYIANQYWAMPLLIVVPYTLIFITLSVANANGPNQKIFLNIADLFAGSYNGLAMSLLFGRYVSIEQAVRNTPRYASFYKHIFHPFSTISYSSFITAGIVFVLPIYALAQPLFGNLRLEEFGDADTFQTWVFGICLVGKICFFHLTYILIGKGILQLYIYGLASSIGNFSKLEACFEKPEEKQEIPG